MLLQILVTILLVLRRAAGIGVHLVDVPRAESVRCHQSNAECADPDLVGCHGAACCVGAGVLVIVASAVVAVVVCAGVLLARISVFLSELALLP